jgi:large subunit ribosomal protein L24
MGQARQAGIIEREATIDVSNVMLVCGKCNKPTRVAFRILGDGKRARVCRLCNEVID